MKKYLLAKFLLFSFIFSFAQSSLEQFTHLESKGDIPEDFHLLMKEKIKDESAFYLKEFFQTGNVLYGTVINEYVNTIADNLLQNDPELRKRIRIYITKSTDVNAFATANGILFVNLGLIAQATNESELAFIIAHEIVHYAEKHIFQLNDYKDRTRSKDLVSSYLKYHTRSRETELDADRLALERYFKNSSYSYSAVDGVFDILQYDYLPFDEIPFRRGYIETSFYQFPDNYFLPSLTPIRSREDYIDTLHTHPNLKKRRENANRIVISQKEDGRKVFVQPEELFGEIKNLVRFECINIYLTQHEYGDALYNTYILMQEYPNNKFLEKALASALYGLAKHKQNATLNDVLDNYKDIEGEKQQVHHEIGRAHV